MLRKKLNEIIEVKKDNKKHLSKYIQPSYIGKNPAYKFNNSNGFFDLDKTSGKALMINPLIFS